MAMYWQPRKETGIGKCSERTTHPCGTEMPGGCCQGGIIPCCYCIEWHPYGKPVVHSPDQACFAGGVWTGTIADLAWTGFWEREEYSGECVFVVTLGGEEIYRKSCYEGHNCSNSSDEAEVSIGYDEGTLKWIKQEYRPLEYVKVFCSDGACHCPCDCLNTTITEPGEYAVTGEICSVDYGDDDQQAWGGTFGNYEIALQLTSYCGFTGTVTRHGGESGVFSGLYGPGNWTQTPGDGSIDTSGAPASISLTSGDTQSGFPSDTEFSIVIATTGSVTFDWSYVTSDTTNSTYDPFGYFVNGIFVKLSVDGISTPQSGTVTVSIVAGQTFGFRQQTVDNTGGSATTTISNFSAPGSGEPLPPEVFDVSGDAEFCENLLTKITLPDGTEIDLQCKEYNPGHRAGYRVHFCGDCECTCLCLCGTVVDPYGVVLGTGELCDASYPCDGPRWTGTIITPGREYLFELQLGSSDSGTCEIRPTVDGGYEGDPVGVTGCKDLSAEIPLDDGNKLIVVCKECECPVSTDCQGCCFPTDEAGNALDLPYEVTGCENIENPTGVLNPLALDDVFHPCGKCGAYGLATAFSIPGQSYNSDGMGGCDLSQACVITFCVQLICGDEDFGESDPSGGGDCCKRMRLLVSVPYNFEGSLPLGPESAIQCFGGDSLCTGAVAPESCSCGPNGVTAIFDLSKFVPKATDPTCPNIAPLVQPCVPNCDMSNLKLIVASA